MTRAAKRLAGELALAYPDSDQTRIEATLAAIVADARRSGTQTSVLDERLEAWRMNFIWRRARWPDAYAALVDLRRKVHGLGAPPRDAMVIKLKSLASFAIEHWIVLTSVLTVAVGGFYTFAYSRFYGILDTTPEQVGLTTAQIISHSVVGGLALALLFSLLCFLVLMPIAPVVDDPDSEQEGPWTPVIANAGLAVAAAALAFFVLDRVWLQREAAMGVALGYLATVIWTHSVHVEGRGSRPRRLVFRLDGYLAVAVIAVGFGVLGTLAATYLEAGDLGDEVRDGRVVRDPTIAGVPFLGVRAEPALVAWSEERPAALQVPRCLFVLGTSRDYVVLYDHRTERTIQVPNGDVALSLRRARTSCEAPVNVVPPVIRTMPTGSYRCWPGLWQSAADREYTFKWSTGGERIPSRLGGASDEIIPPADRIGELARCRVEATTEMGSDIAISDGVLLWGESLRGGRLGGARRAVR